MILPVWIESVLTAFDQKTEPHNEVVVAEALIAARACTLLSFSGAWAALLEGLTDTVHTFETVRSPGQIGNEKRASVPERCKKAHPLGDSQPSCSLTPPQFASPFPLHLNLA